MGACSSCHCKCCRCRESMSRKIVIVLLGLDNAGKTTALKGLAGEPTEYIVPTIGFSSYVLKYKGHDVQIYDLGGSPNIRGIWSKYFSDVHGIIYVIDASALDRINESRRQLEQLLEDEKLSGKPVLLLANKQDLPGALDELDVVERLNLEVLVNRQKCPTSVETCAASLSPDPAISNGYKWLLEMILKDFETLDNRVRSDTESQKLVEEKIQQERRQRVEKLRQKRLEDNGIPDSNGKDENPNINPFRPISELTADKDTSSLGHRIILVQQSPPPQTNKGDMGEGRRKNVEAPSMLEDLTNPTDESSEKKRKGCGLLPSRNNKTAPLPPGSPVRKTTLPPLKQVTSPIAPTEAIPWIKPVLPISTTNRKSAGSERAWGLEQELEAVPLSDSQPDQLAPSDRIQVTPIQPKSIKNGY